MKTGDERGVSTVLSYTLSLGITMVLIAGLFLSVGGLVDTQRERTTRSELEVLGQTLASEVTAADRLVRAGSGTSSRSLQAASIDYDMPTTVGETSYSITLRPGSNNPEIELRSRDPTVVVTITVATVTPVSESAASGGPIRIQYCIDETKVQCKGNAGTLVIGNE